MTVPTTAEEIAMQFGVEFAMPHHDRLRLEKAILRHMEHHMAPLHQEIDFLRRYGNKDCTGMADEALEEKRRTGKAPFEC